MGVLSTEIASLFTAGDQPSRNKDLMLLVFGGARGSDPILLQEIGALTI
jgi:hypothetical protein